jgi:hypothetical protein
VPLFLFIFDFRLRGLHELGELLPRSEPDFTAAANSSGFNHLYRVERDELFEGTLRTRSRTPDEMGDEIDGTGEGSFGCKWEPPELLE